MIRKLVLLVIAIGVLFVAVSCGSVNSEIEITGFGGEAITVNTDGLSAEQINALQSVADGGSDIRELMQSGLFSLEEIQELGLMPNAAQGGVKMGGNLKNLTMEDLNLDGLDAAQIEEIQKVLDGKRTPQSLIEEGLLTLEEMKQVGLMGDLPAARKEGAVPKDRTTSKQTEATQEAELT